MQNRLLLLDSLYMKVTLQELYFNNLQTTDYYDWSFCYLDVK